MKPRIVSCINRTCEWKGNFTSLSKHLQEDCKLEEQRCTHCGQVLPRLLWAHHPPKCPGRTCNELKRLHILEEEQAELRIALQTVQEVAQTHTQTVLTNDTLLYLAQIQEQAEEYQAMAKSMQAYCKRCLEEKKELSQADRNLFSVAHRQVLGQYRSGYRIFSSKPNTASTMAYKSYFVKRCLGMLHNHIELTQALLAASKDLQNVVSYMKTQGDDLRYAAEMMEGREAEDMMMKSRNALFEAEKTIRKIASPVDPIRLGLGLSHATFQYEVLGNKAVAIASAQQLFTEALEHIDEIEDIHYKDVQSILLLLRNNLAQWTQANPPP